MAKRLLADIRSLARSHAPNALNVLQGLMNEPTTPAASRIAAAEILLNRGYGKPTQPIGGEDGKPIRVQAIAWLDTIEASDRAKVIEGHPAPTKENGQKTLTNGNSPPSIWDNRVDIVPTNPTSVGSVEPARTDVIAIERLADELPE